MKFSRSQIARLLTQLDILERNTDHPQYVQWMGEAMDFLRQHRPSKYRQLKIEAMMRLGIRGGYFE